MCSLWQNAWWHKVSIFILPTNNYSNIYSTSMHKASIPSVSTDCLELLAEWCTTICSSRLQTTAQVKITLLTVFNDDSALTWQPSDQAPLNLLARTVISFIVLHCVCWYLIFRVTTFQTTWNSPSFPVGAGKDLIINILFNAMVNSCCFTLIKYRTGSQGFKHCNWLTEDYNSVNENIWQLRYWVLTLDICTPQTDSTDNGFVSLVCLLQNEADFSYPDFSVTSSIFPDFSLTTMEFPDFSRFSRWVVTLNIVTCHKPSL